MYSDHKPRKLQAILYADVFGYTRLTQEDEDTTHRVLREYLDLFAEIIASHRGRVVHYAGDAVLACFDAVIDALEAALEVQAELEERNQLLPEIRRVKFRIGVNLGDIIEDGNEIFGHGVNVAARLETLAEPGGICVSEAVRAAAGQNLPVDYRFLGRRQVKNVAERLRVYRAIPTGPLPRSAREPPRKEWLRSGRTRVATARASARAGKPAIVVLPFLNLTDDPEQAYFVDGFTEDLITELSRFRSLAVTARTSAFAVSDKGLNVREIARELDVDFVLEGSIRKVQEHLRISAQLIESKGGSHVWADRHDCLTEEIFVVQDKFISQIVGTLENRIVETCLHDIGRMPLHTLEAYDCWLRGNRLMQEWRPEADAEAIGFFERSMELDPDFARPYSSLAGIYSSRSLMLPGNPQLGENLRRAEEYARQGLERDPLDGKVHMHLGWVHLQERQFDRARRAFAKASELNPNDADIAIATALVRAFLGDPDHGLELAEIAIANNPFHPDYYLGYRAIIEFLAAHYEATVHLLDSMHDVHPPDLWAWRASASAHLARMDDARESVGRFIGAMRESWAGARDAGPPEYVAWVVQVTPLAKPEHAERLLRGLVAAGLPSPPALA